MHCSKWKKCYSNLSPNRIRNERNLQPLTVSECELRSSRNLIKVGYFISPGLQLKNEKTSMDDMSGMMMRKKMMLLRAHFPLSSLALTRNCGTFRLFVIYGGVCIHNIGNNNYHDLPKSSLWAQYCREDYLWQLLPKFRTEHQNLECNRLYTSYNDTPQFPSSFLPSGYQSYAFSLLKQLLSPLSIQEEEPRQHLTGH